MQRSKVRNILLVGLSKFFLGRPGVDELLLSLLLSLFVQLRLGVFIYVFVLALVFHFEFVFMFFAILLLRTGLYNIFSQVDITAFDALLEADLERIFDLTVAGAFNSDGVVVPFQHIHGVAVSKHVVLRVL